MSAQLTGYWEPIDARSDLMSGYLGGDDDEYTDNNGRLEPIVDPNPPYSIIGSLLLVFTLASGIFFATMSILFFEVHTVLETLQLPQQHPVFSDLRRMENIATLLFVTIFLGFAALAVWGALRSSRNRADTR